MSLIDNEFHNGSLKENINYFFQRTITLRNAGSTYTLSSEIWQDHQIANRSLGPHLSVWK